MFAILPASQHYSVEELGTSLKLVFPYRKEWLDIIFLTLILPFIWLLSIGLIASVARQIVLPLEMSMGGLLLLCFVTFVSTLISANGAVELLWFWLGKEVVEISDDYINIRHQILGLGIAQRFCAGDVNVLFVSRVKTNWFAHSLRKGSRYFDFKQGRVVFKCGRTIWGGVTFFRFGTILDEEEAGQVVSVIHKRFPQYMPQRQRASAHT